MLSEFLRLHDAGIRPQIVSGMWREEQELAEAIAKVREYVGHTPNEEDAE